MLEYVLNIIGLEIEATFKEDSGYYSLHQF